MKAFKNKHTLLTLMLRKNQAEKIMTDEILKKSESAVLAKGRGTLIREKWSDAFLPSIHPEQDCLSLLLENDQVSSVIETLIKEGGLSHAGSGAILSFPCTESYLAASKESKKTSRKRVPKTKAVKKDLMIIICILQKGKSESLAKAAVDLGAPGPVIVYGKGKGIRDRMGLLRVAISPDKEIFSVIVDKEEANAVFDTLSKEGNLDLPGEGFIYMLPVQEGMVNIQSVFKKDKHSASMRQIVKAIDDLKGNSDWRTLLDADNSSTDFNCLENISRLTCIADCGDGDSLVKKALEHGAPGASIITGQALEREQKMKNEDLQFTKEKEMIEMMLDPKKVNTIIKELSALAKKEKLSPLIFYTHSVPKAFTYLGA